MHQSFPLLLQSLFIFCPFLPLLFSSFFFPSCCRLYICFLPKFTCGGPNPHVVVLEVGSLGCNQIWMMPWGQSSYDDIGSHIRGRRDQSSLLAMWGYGEKVAVYEPGNGSSLEFSHAGALILDFQSLGLWQINVCWLSHPVYAVLLLDSSLPKPTSLSSSTHYTIPKMLKKLSTIPTFGSWLWTNRMLPVFHMTAVELPWARNEHSHLALAQKRQHL